jgi:hypothetical protein
MLSPRLVFRPGDAPALGTLPVVQQLFNNFQAHPSIRLARIAGDVHVAPAARRYLAVAPAGARTEPGGAQQREDLGRPVQALAVDFLASPVAGAAFAEGRDVAREQITFLS